VRKAGAEDARVSADVHTEIVRNDAGRLRVGKIRVALHPDAPAALIEQCASAFEDFCVVTQSVRKGIDVEAVIVPLVPKVEQRAAS